MIDSSDGDVMSTVRFAAFHPFVSQGTDLTTRNKTVSLLTASY